MFIQFCEEQSFASAEQSFATARDFLIWKGLEMKKFAIFRNTDKDPRGVVSKNIADHLTAKGGICIVLDDDEELCEEVDCAIVLGGDGTLLRAAKKVIDRDFPLLGVNLGTLGYLAEVDRNSIYTAMDRLLTDRYTIEKRMMLQGTVFRGNEELLSDVALNDVCIVRQGPLRVVRFLNYVNGAFLNSYQADGVILSTATGSTGYSLSAGGPIVSPEANVILMTPISPHTMNMRSIIFKSSDRIVVEIGRGHIKTDAEACVSFDGGAYVSVTEGDRIEIKKSEKCTKIVKINDISFLEVLRQKMAGT